MRSFGIWIRIMGLLLILYGFFQYGPSFQDVMERLSGHSLNSLAGATGLYLLALWWSGLRIRLIAHSNAIELTRWQAFSMVLKSIALNTFMLTGAGEIYKISVIASLSKKTVLASTVVIFERLFGALIQLAFGLCMFFALVQLSEFPKIELDHLPVITAFLALVILLSLAAFRFIPAVVLRDVVQGLRSAFRSAWRTLGLFASSILLIASMIGSAWLLAQGAGLEIGFNHLLYAVPLVAVSTLVPITFGGVGIREAGYVLMLQPAGVTSADCIALGLSQYAVFLISVLIGTAIFITDKEKVVPSTGPN